jgi:hypothetical protein
VLVTGGAADAARRRVTGEPGRRRTLAVLIVERHWRQEDFCAEFERAARALAADAVVSVRQLARWLSGESWPGATACRVLEAMFARPVAQLLAPAPTGAGGVGIGLAVPDGMGPAGVGGANLEGVGFPRPLSRPSGGAWPVEWERSVVVMSAHESADHAGQVGAAALDAETMDTLRGQVAWLARSYAATPPLTLHQQAGQVRALLYRMIERTRRPA